MYKRLLLPCVFALGLVAIGWVIIGYLGSNPLGVAVALLIGAGYLAGAVELAAYRRATATLQHALASLPASTDTLPDWLARVHAGLRHAVRQRVQGERVALPAPALTPYLVGLLVLLGMLGTLLGMMATLRGTGTALGSASDLAAIRTSLAAPVNGLAFAFGTSIAGVASSAMLGLLSALVRRERLQVVQALDAAVAGPLHAHTQAHQREQGLQLLQQQAAVMPALVERLQAMADTLERQQATMHQQAQAEREAFHHHVQETQAQLARTLQQSLQAGVAEGARATGELLQPMLASTLAALAREGEALHVRVGDAVQRQLDGLAGGLTDTTQHVTTLCSDTLAQHQQVSQAHAQALAEALQRFADTFEARSGSLIDSLGQRLADTTRQVSTLCSDTLAQQQQADQVRTQALGEALQRFTDTFDERSGRLLDGVAARSETAIERNTATWQAALDSQQEAHATMVAQHRQALAATSDAFQMQTTALVQAVDQSHAQLQATLAAADRTRLTQWSDTLDAIGQRIDARWSAAAEAGAARQQAICDTLEHTANAIATQAREQAGHTLAEIGRLVEAAAEAPRVAAEVVGELRQKLSDSMVRDTAMLEERARLMTTLETLLDAVNHASTTQRGAIDALLGSSAELLERVGNRFAEQVENQGDRLERAAARLTASASEVASLGEAFGAGVAQFGQTGDALVQRLQQLTEALAGAQARSDEQLAYYVAQARELVELSVLSQQQIIGEMQQLAGRRAPGKAARA